MHANPGIIPYDKDERETKSCMLNHVAAIFGGTNVLNT